MDSLILHLSGPLQSWGTGAGRFGTRDTAAMPTKSAIIGLIAACQGRSRLTDVTDLATAVVATRSDRPGIAIRDYHTTGAMGRHAKARLRTASGANHLHAIVTDRWYLADAAFTAAVGAAPDFIAQLHEVMLSPRFAPYLGRRCCPPDVGLIVGVLSDVDPWEALTERVPLVRAEPCALLRVVCDDPEGRTGNVNDAVHGPLDRRYGRRLVRDELVDVSHLPTVNDSIELIEFLAGVKTDD